MPFTSNVPVTVLSAPTADVVDCKTVVPVPPISFDKSPVILNIELLVTVPPNFVISDDNVPEVIVTSFAIEPVSTVTVPVPALISVSPLPEIAVVSVPAVKFKVPELSTVFFNVPAPVVNAPVVATFIALFKSLFPVFVTAPVIAVVPLPVISAFMSPPVSVNVLLALFISVPARLFAFAVTLSAITICAFEIV